MTLRRKIINFRRLYRADDFDQTTRVRHVAVMQLHFTLPMTLWVFVKMLNTRGVEWTGSPDDAMHIVSFFQ